MHIPKVRVITLENWQMVDFGACFMVMLVWCRIFSLIFQKQKLFSLNPCNGLTCSWNSSCKAVSVAWQCTLCIWFLCRVGFDILSCWNKLRRFLSERTLVSQDSEWQHRRRVTSYYIKVSLKQRKQVKCSFVAKFVRYITCSWSKYA